MLTVKLANLGRVSSRARRHRPGSVSRGHLIPNAERAGPQETVVGGLQKVTAVRLEFPILSLNPGLRQRCVALGPGSFSDHLPIERLPIAMLPLPERILAAFQDAADGLADARPQDSSPSAHSRLMVQYLLERFL